MKSITAKIAAILILALCVDSMAAVVSDNDGAAFITKAEFDSLKNDFQSQLDNYNTGIDAKIDNAISSYLSGLKVEKSQVISLPLKAWEKVTAVNYAIENDYWYPDIDLTTVMLGGMRYSAEVPRGSESEVDPVNNRYGYENYWGNCQLKYTRPSDKHSRRLLCDAGSEGTTYPNYITWKGWATDYLDKITFSRVINIIDERWEGTSWGNGTGYLSGSMNNAMVLSYATQIFSGYFPNLESATDNIWYPRWFWTNSSSWPDFWSGRTRAGYRGVGSIFAYANALSIVLQPLNNKTITYEHLLNFNNYNYDYFSDVDWQKTLTNVPDTSLTRESQLQIASVSNTWAVLEWWNPGHFRSKDSEGNWDLTALSWELRYHEADPLLAICSGAGWGRTYAEHKDESPIVSVGLIPKVYDSKHIYQSNDVFKQTVDGVSFTRDKMNLYNGFSAFAAKKDDVVEWEPVFIDTYSNGVATDFELYVSLAIEPFGEGNTVSSNDKFIKLNSQTTAAPAETTSKSCKLKFTMPENGIVYVKWWPKDTSIQSTDWEATLDLTQCSAYSRTVES